MVQISTVAAAKELRTIVVPTRLEATAGGLYQSVVHVEVHGTLVPWIVSVRWSGAKPLRSWFDANTYCM